MVLPAEADSTFMRTVAAPRGTSAIKRRPLFEIVDTTDSRSSSQKLMSTGPPFGSITAVGGAVPPLLFPAFTAVIR
jgi:hypothetical protein